MGRVRERKRKRNEGPPLGFSELVQDGIDLSEGLIDLLSELASCSNFRERMVQVPRETHRRNVGRSTLTFAPVSTIFPETKMRSTTLGLTIR